MNPVTHFLSGWALANISELDKKSRAIVTISAVSADIDGVGIIADIIIKNRAEPIYAYETFHHALLHNLAFAIIFSIAAYILSGRKIKTAAIALLGFHLHLVSDIIIGRGPEGEVWGISYLYPFSKGFKLAWPGQWELNSWQSFAITVILLAVIFFIAAKMKRSPLEMISAKADAAFISAVRNRLELS